MSGEALPTTSLRPEEFSSAVSAITSAFGDPTRRQIYLFARESESGVTASEVAEKFGLHANVARHHLDHASTSPTRPEALEAMLPWFGIAADPGRVHTEGHAARVAIEVAREQVAALLGARSR